MGGLTEGNLDIWVRGLAVKSLAARIPDQKAAAGASADETQPHLAAGRPGEILLGRVQVRTGESRQIVVRWLTIARKTE